MSVEKTPRSHLVSEPYVDLLLSPNSQQKKHNKDKNKNLPSLMSHEQHDRPYRVISVFDYYVFPSPYNDLSTGTCSFSCP